MLTDEDIRELYETHNESPLTFARAVIAAYENKLLVYKPVAYSWIDKESDDVMVMGASHYDANEAKSLGINAFPLYRHPEPSIPEGWKPINGECNHDGTVVVLHTNGDTRISHSNWLGKQMVKPYNRPAMPAYMSSIDEGWSHWMPLPKPPTAAARSGE